MIQAINLMFNLTYFNMKQTQSQEKLIMQWMQSGKSITPIEALNLFGCFRLGARILDLKNKGIEVKSEYITVESGKRVKRYWI